jgi:alpha-glucosidase
MGTPPECNVAAQRADPGSVLTFTRDLLALRRSNPDLHRGAYRSLASPPGTWAWRRGEGFATAVNLGEEASVVDGLTGSVALGTDRGRDGQPVAGSFALGPGEGALVRLA